MMPYEFPAGQLATPQDGLSAAQVVRLVVRRPVVSTNLRPTFRPLDQASQKRPVLVWGHEGIRVPRFP